MVNGMTQNSIFRVDFSLRREVFFFVIGATIGAITMVVPNTFLYTGLGLPYYLGWLLDMLSSFIIYYCWGSNSYDYCYFNWSLSDRVPLQNWYVEY
ncbi:MAG: hypothetical protein WAM14_22820 [Candidatus Nitrosopolaris sp.]